MVHAIKLHRHCSLTRHITNLYVQVPDIMQKPFKKLLCIKTLQILSIASKIISIVNSKKLHLIKQIHIEVLFLQIVIIDIFNFHKISIRDSARDQYIDVRGLKRLFQSKNTVKTLLMQKELDI